MTRSTLIALAVLAFAAAPAHAVTNIFNGTTDTDWNTNTNWSQGHVPTSGEDVSISVSGKNPSLSADGVANSLTITANNHVTITGHTLAVGGGSSAISGQILFGTNGVLTVAGTMSLTRTDLGGVISAFGAPGARVDIAVGWHDRPRRGRDGPEHGHHRLDPRPRGRHAEADGDRHERRIDRPSSRSTTTARSWQRRGGSCCAAGPRRARAATAPTTRPRPHRSGSRSRPTWAPPAA